MWRRLVLVLFQDAVIIVDSHAPARHDRLEALSARDDAGLAHVSMLTVGGQNHVGVYHDGHSVPTRRLDAASVRATMSPISSPKKFSGQLVMSPTKLTFSSSSSAPLVVRLAK